MTGALDFVCDFIEEPKKAARVAVERQPIFLGVLGLLVGAASLFLAQGVTRRFLPFGRGPASFVFECAWTFVWGLVLTAVLHLIADVWGGPRQGPNRGPVGSAAGGRGSAAALFVLLGLSELSWALMLPVTLLLRAFNLDYWFVLFLVFSVVGWLSMRLKARSLRDVYGLSLSRAWTLLLLPYLACTAFVLAMFAAAVLGTAFSIARLFS